MDLLQIEAPDTATTKGRTFEALLVSYLRAQWLWPQSSDNERPVWCVYAGTDTQARPFTANLQSGRKAKVGRGVYSREGLFEGTTFEFLKSAGYVFATQRFKGMSVVTAYLPHFFNLDPGMVDPEKIEFIAAPSSEWCAARAKVLPVEAAAAHARKYMGTSLKNGPTDADLRAMVPVASHFAAMLDRRTRGPLIPDARFHLQLMLACIREGMAALPMLGRHTHWSDSPWGSQSESLFCWYGAPDSGLAGVVGCRGKHQPFQELLASEVSLYFETAGR